MSDNIKELIVFALTELSKDRHVFHSESDFQHEFATILKLHFKTYLNRDIFVLLERPFSFRDDGIIKKCDIVILDNQKFYPIELKYKVKNLFNQGTLGEDFTETFILSNQNSHPQYRY